ncbi:MAG: putative sphingomyelin phosphodiesterase [Candidatus Nomurabacteria bacterium]|nr:putative sphingomyelin phosphodiesterase [Candidatus Nomurabacteria bacterium]
MEIITYNIWDLPLWFVRDRERRLLQIGKFLADRKTDIICLQESWSLKHRSLLSEYMRSQGYYDAVSEAGIRRNNGGLLTFSKYPIRSVRFIPFGRWGISVSEIIGNKGVLETILETPKGLLRILNIHLHHQSSKFINTNRIRIRQLHTLFATMKHEPDLPTVLAGDFNEHDMMKDSPLGKMLNKNGFGHHDGFEGVFPSYRKENPHVNNWINRVLLSERYDYILTKDIEQLGLSIKSNEPLYIEPALSDHDPVSLILV